LGWGRERSCVGEDGIGALGWRSACGWIWLGGSSSRKGLEESLWMDLARWELEQEGIGGSSVLWREGIREGCARSSGDFGVRRRRARAEILGCGDGALERDFSSR